MNGATTTARWLMLAGCLVLAACAPQRSVRVEPIDDAPVGEGGRGSEPVIGEPATRPGEYVVARGDTLYQIAFRHGLDYRDVARRNRIEPPYTIYPGQTLHLGEAAIARPPPVARRPAGATARSTGSGLIASTAKPETTQPSAPRPSSPAPAMPTIAPSAASNASPAAADGSEPAVARVEPPVGSSAPSTPPRLTPPAPLPKGPVAWRWPASGKTVTTFLAGDPTRQGVGIAGSNGQPVYAAGDGVVVYSGAGLIGYGELVIIKHSDEWLSAYGHNRKRLVSEGQAVSGGEQIAEMGRSGASRDMLHFEIRRNGKPVDPLQLLPKR